jgi:hypothetical protein
MRLTILLVQSLALMGTVAALTETQVQQPAKNFVTQKFQGNKKPLTEAEVFNRPRPEIKQDTPEQKAAAEKYMQEIDKRRATQPEQKNRHPDLVLHKAAPLTKAEQEKLLRARNGAIQDSKAHQVHTDESKFLFDKFW